MQNMREMLRTSLARSLQTMDPLDRLAAAWPVACGSALAGRSEVASYDGEVVEVLVASEEWEPTFAQMRPVLQAELARIAGVRVGALHFEVKAKKLQAELRKAAMDKRAGSRRKPARRTGAEGE
jgi:hypothetical protein